jgi:hypothetical protein
MRSALLHAGLIALLLVSVLVKGAYATPVNGPGTPDQHRGGVSGIDERALPPMPNISGFGMTPDARDWYEEGFALTGQERYSDALRAYEKALSYDPSLLNAWYYAGDALFRLGRYQEALLAFGNATAVDPDFVDAYFYESRVYERLGRSRNQTDALERGLEAAERVKAREEAGTSPPPVAPGYLAEPVSPLTSFLGAGMATGLLTIMRRKKGT